MILKILDIKESLALEAVSISIKSKHCTIKPPNSGQSLFFYWYKNHFKPQWKPHCFCDFQDIKQWITLTAWKVSVFRVFLVLIFPHSYWIRRDTACLPVFSMNAWKYWPEYPNTDTFHAVQNARIAEFR